MLTNTGSPLTFEAFTGPFFHFDGEISQELRSSLLLILQYIFEFAQASGWNVDMKDIHEVLPKGKKVDRCVVGH